MEKAKERALLSEELLAVEKQALTTDTGTRLARDLRARQSELPAQNAEKHHHEDRGGDVDGQGFDRAAFEKSYEAMDDAKKWTLTTVTVVDDALYQFGLAFTNIWHILS